MIAYPLIGTTLTPLQVIACISIIDLEQMMEAIRKVLPRDLPVALLTSQEDNCKENENNYIIISAYPYFV